MTSSPALSPHADLNWITMYTPDDDPLAGRRFLIIEDEIFQAGHIEQMLVEMGGAVERIAVTHEQARQAAHNTTADCALLDINLGGTLSHHIAEILQFRGIPFIVCTAYADEAVDVLAAVRHAPRLAKPLEIMELRDAVLHLLEPNSVLERGRLIDCQARSHRSPDANNKKAAHLQDGG